MGWGMAGSNYRVLVGRVTNEEAALRGGIQLWGFWFCSVRWVLGRRWKVRDSDSGGGRPAWFSPVFLWICGRQARGSRLRASLPPVFQFLLTHSEGWEARFLAAVAGCMGFSEGNDGGDFPRAEWPEFLARCVRGSFQQGPFARDLPLSIVDLPSPGWGIRKRARDPVG